MFLLRSELRYTCPSHRAMARRVMGERSRVKITPALVDTYVNKYVTKHPDSGIRWTKAVVYLWLARRFFKYEELEEYHRTGGSENSFWDIVNRRQASKAKRKTKRA